MKKTVCYLFAFLFISLVFFSCKKDTPSPMEKAILDGTGKCACEPYINQYVWRKKAVYLSSARGPYCNSIPMYYDHNGANLTMENGYTVEDFLDESRFVANIWTCEE